MDHERCCIEELDGTMLENFSFFIDTEQVACLDLREGNAKWIDPERIMINRILIRILANANPKVCKEKCI